MKPGGSVLMSRNELAGSLAVAVLCGGIWGYVGGESWTAIIARAFVIGVMYALVVGVYFWIRTKKSGL